MREEEMSEDRRARAREVMHSAIVWDNHGCLPLRADATFLPQLERYRKSGVNVASINVGYADMPWWQHLEVLSVMRQWIAQRPKEYELISTVEDVERCKVEKKLGIVFDVEGMCPVQDRLSLVQTFYELGVRWMLIAYNRNNQAGGGCMDVDEGLTSVGRAIIDEMERVGMVLCLSHTGSRTAAEALEYSRKPAIFSHSNPFGDAPHVRNISDDLMLACSRKGGVVGLSGLGPFLGANENLIEHFLRQLRYVIDLVGPEHVGLGLDYVFDRATLDENVRRYPERYAPGIANGLAMIEPESIEAIVDGLSGAHLSDTQIRGILGENWLRVATQVWR